MTNDAFFDTFGELIEPATLRIQRLLPGPIERVWEYLTDSDLRSRWLAAGVMDLRVNAPFKLTWRNDELTDPPGERPEGFPEEHHMESRITELDPPHKLSFAWEGSGDVSIELEPQGEDVLLTLIHHRLPTRNSLMGVGTGWHLHLNILVARLRGDEPEPVWESWRRLKPEYERRIPSDTKE